MLISIVGLRFNPPSQTDHNPSIFILSRRSPSIKSPSPHPPSPLHRSRSPPPLSFSSSPSPPASFILSRRFFADHQIRLLHLRLCLSVGLLLLLLLSFRDLYPKAPSSYSSSSSSPIAPFSSETAKRSNLRHRPIGIGVQGLADTFILLGMPFDSPEAQQLNKDIFETIYYHALKTSSEIAAKEGTYETYQGSPVSKILGNNECFEPYTSNIYSRRVLSGEFVLVNKHLLYDLTEMGLWSPALKNIIIYEGGSVVKIPEILEHLKAIYKTVWEIKQRTLVDMAIDRGCYIDQSQSLNIHMDQPNFGKLTSLHFYAWSKEIQNTKSVEDEDAEAKAQVVCFLNNREECMACGS